MITPVVELMNKMNPIQAVIVAVLVTLTGSVGTSVSTAFVSGGKAYATEQYVDVQIDQVSTELQYTGAKSDYKFAIQHKRAVEKEIFELKMLKQRDAIGFTTMHERRLAEKLSELGEATTEAAEYRKLIKK